MHNQRILITGVCGFTGRHLVAHLCHVSSASITGIDTLAEPALPVDRYFACDLTDQAAVNEVVNESRPTTVFHLAGLMGGAAADAVMRVNIGGFQCLVSALRRLESMDGRPIRLVTVGSAAEIGSKSAAKLPVVEDVPCQPESPYGQSKWEVTQRALVEPAGGPLEIIVARPFNLVGPGLSPQLALGNFARQIAAAIRGETSEVRCGPLDTRRDFVDVRDAVAAYVQLAERGRHGQIYNVCLGKSFRLGRLLEILITLANVQVRVVSESPPRPGDLKDIYGDRAKISREVGWKPTISIEHSLADLLAAA